MYLSDSFSIAGFQKRLNMTIS